MQSIYRKSGLVLLAVVAAALALLLAASDGVRGQAETQSPQIGTHTAKQCQFSVSTLDVGDGLLAGYTEGTSPLSGESGYLGHVAVQPGAAGPWQVIEAFAVKYRTYVGVFCTEQIKHGVYTLAYPIADYITPAHVNGATLIQLNAAGTHWEFRRTNDGTHHDIGLSIESAVAAVFRQEIDGVMSDILALDPRDTPHARKVAERATLVKVQGSVLVAAVKAHNGRARGHYHKDAHPEDGHVLATVQAAFAAVKAEWAASSSLRTQWARASSALGRIETGIATRAAVSIEDPWTQEARLAREAEAGG